jgi:hypothetical protein
MNWNALFGNVADNYTTENNDAFKQSLAACAVILWSAKNPGMIQRLIQFFSGSKYFHASIYIGKTPATLIRQLYPEFLKNTTIPKEAQYNEMIEAHIEDGVRVRPLLLDDENIQLTAYIRPITQAETLKILHAAYLQVGEKYDTLEAVGDAGIPLPNDPNKPVCSDVVVEAWLPVERIVASDVDINKTKPSDIGKYLEREKGWKKTTWNC